MLSCCTNYLNSVPNITVYINCDTRLAINLRMFGLGENDEFIFVIKNFNYIDSPCVYLFRARKSDMNENGEVIFKITPADSKRLKPGAFYNFAVLLNAFDKYSETEYRKLTENGKIIIEYGAQDLSIEPDYADNVKEIISVRLEPIQDVNDIPENPKDKSTYKIVGLHLEMLEEA